MDWAFEMDGPLAGQRGMAAGGSSSAGLMYSVALLLSVEVLNRALKRRRFQAATSHSFHILL